MQLNKLDLKNARPASTEIAANPPLQRTLPASSSSARPPLEKAQTSPSASPRQNCRRLIPSADEGWVAATHPATTLGVPVGPGRCPALSVSRRTAGVVTLSTQLDYDGYGDSHGPSAARLSSFVAGQGLLCAVLPRAAPCLSVCGQRYTLADVASDPVAARRLGRWWSL